MNATPEHSFDSSRDASQPSIDDLDAAIGRLSVQANATHYELLVLVREFDDRLGWAQWSFRNCAEWLAWRCGLSLSAARENVRTAQALHTLPQISAAFGDGRLSYSKVRALTRVADVDNEDLLVAYALDATAAQVEARCRQMRNAHAASVDTARRAWESRSLLVWHNAAAGTVTIRAELPRDAADVVTAALERAVEAGEVATGPEFDGLGWQAQQADALVAIAKAYSGESVAPDDVAGDEDAAGDGHGNGNGALAEPPKAVAARGRHYSPADHHQLVVHVSESALRGGGGRADLPIETVKRLGCDAMLVAVVENERGEPLDVGRRQRTVPLSIRRALRARDRCCAFPGCHRTRFVEAHHVQHWVDGGATSLANTLLLCSHHHTLVHEGGCRIGRDHEGRIYFERPDGRVIPRCGYRIDDALPDPGVLGQTSAEGWLAAAVRGRRPPGDAVREQRAAYCV